VCDPPIKLNVAMKRNCAQGFEEILNWYSG
jgi:hypothetical protein